MPSEAWFVLDTDTFWTSWSSVITFRWDSSLLSLCLIKCLKHRQPHDWCSAAPCHRYTVKAKGPGSVETAEDQASSDHHTLSTEWAHGVRSDLSSWMNDGSSKRVIYCTDVCMLYCWFHSLLSDLHTHQHKTHLTRNKSTTTKSFYVFIPTSMKGNLIFIHINSLKTCEHTRSKVRNSREV